MWKGTAFGGWKSRQDVPKLVNKAMLNELPIKQYVTHTLDGLDKVGEVVDLMHSGNCLRGVIKITPEPEVGEVDQIKVVSTQKFFGGFLKKVVHQSKVTNCEMTFYIFLPEDEICRQRRDRPYPALYFLAGLTSNWENVPFKSGFAKFAKKRDIAMVFPDTSPRGVDDAIPEAGDADFSRGYGAGHYCDATQAPWNQHFNMYSYVTKELPGLVERYFFVDSERKSITGFSMGGNGALVAAAKNPGMYKSVTAFAPICAPTKCDAWTKTAYESFFGNRDERSYGISELLTDDESLTLPAGFVDFASCDQFDGNLMREELESIVNKRGIKLPFRVQEGYDHSFFFISSFIEEHIDFHAARLSI